MTTVINIHKDSFMFMTGVMSCLWQWHDSLMHTPSNKVLPNQYCKKHYINKGHVKRAWKCF